MFKKSAKKFSKNKGGPRFSADEIKLHNDNAKLRNEVSKELEGKRRSNTLRALGFESTQTKINSESSQLESTQTEINSETSSSNVTESIGTNNINKI